MVTVKFGNSLRNLSTIETIKNVKDEYSGQVRYELTHTVRADRIAYRFEFMSSDETDKCRFVVEQGGYAHKEIEPLEQSDGSNRVISSFVKVSEWRMRDFERREGGREGGRSEV